MNKNWAEMDEVDKLDGVVLTPSNYHTIGAPEGAYRLLPMQEGLLFHSLSAPDSGMYVGQVVCALDPHTDIAAFERAWKQVIGRHSVFRTSFLSEGHGIPLQQEHSHAGALLEICDWGPNTAAGATQSIETCLKDERSRSLDLSQAPAMRLKLLKLPGNELLFIWAFHHALLDGRARTLVLKEVAEFYEAFCRNKDPQLSEPPCYRRYIEWYYQQDFSRAEAYWRALLETFTSPISFPLHVENGPKSERFGTTEISLPAELKMGIKSLAAAQRVTPNIVVQAAWTLLLSRYSCQRDVVFGETRACRRGDFRGAASVVGLLMNTIPIRIFAGPTKTIADLLQELRAQHIASRDHEHLPLRRIAMLSGASGSLQLFNSVVVFEEYDPEAALKQAGAVLWQRVRRSVPTHYPLTVIGYSKPQLFLQLSFDRTIVDNAAACRIAAQLAELLHRVSSYPQARTSEFPILTPAEHAQVIVDWNATTRDYPDSRCVHRLFEEQVATAPTRIALVQGQRRLTYEELNVRANQLAQQLRKCGVGPEIRVGVHLIRSVEAIITLLAVLKAGGAYVPLDPNYPIERLAFMIENAQVQVLVSRRPLTLSLDSRLTNNIDLNTFSFEAAPSHIPLSITHKSSSNHDTQFNVDKAGEPSPNHHVARWGIAVARQIAAQLCQLGQIARNRTLATICMGFVFNYSI